MASLEETLYGLLDSSTSDSFTADGGSIFTKPITEEEHQKNIASYLAEDERLRKEGFMPPTERQRIAEGRQVKLYTNDPTAYEEARKVGKPAKLYSSNLQEPQLSNLDPNKEFMKSISEQVKNLEKLTDNPTAYAEQVAQTAASIAAKEAEFKKSAQTQAYAKYGIPALEQMVSLLKRKEQLDPIHVATYGKIDGPEVIAAKQRLQAAMNSADGAIPEMLSSNDAYQVLQVYSKTLLGKADESLQRVLNKKDMQEREAIEKLSGFTPEEKENLIKLTGYADATQQLAFIRGNAKNFKELDATLKARPDQLPALTLSGNRFATQLILEEEKQIYGAKAVENVVKLQKIATDQLSAQEAFKEMRATGFLGTKTKEWEKQFSAAIAGTMGAEEQQKASRTMQTQIAKKYGEFIASKEFKEDIVSLQDRSKVPVPDWVRSIALDPKISGNGKVSMEQATSVLMSFDDPTIRKQRLQELVNYYNEAMKTQNNSSLFKVSPTIIDELRQRVAINVLDPMSGLTYSERVKKLSAIRNSPEYMQLEVAEKRALQSGNAIEANRLMQIRKNLLTNVQGEE